MSTPQTPPRGDPWGSAGPPTATMPVAQPAPRPSPQPSTVGRPRKARLVLARVDPWSVMKLSFLLAIGLAIVLVVAVSLLWWVLDSMGVFDSVSQTVESVTRSSDRAQGIDIYDFVGFHHVIKWVGLLTAVNVILMTALGTLGAFVYNLAASLVGGLHVTLTEDA